MLFGPTNHKEDSTGKSPFELVYGLTATLPVSMQIPVFRMISEYGTKGEEMELRINHIIELDESRRAALDQVLTHQESVKGPLTSRQSQDLSKLETSSFYGTKGERSRASMESLTASREAPLLYVTLSKQTLSYSTLWKEKGYPCLCMDSI